MIGKTYTDPSNARKAALKALGKGNFIITRLGDKAFRIDAVEAAKPAPKAAPKPKAPKAAPIGKAKPAPKVDPKPKAAKPKAEPEALVAEPNPNAQPAKRQTAPRPGTKAAIMFKLLTQEGGCTALELTDAATPGEHKTMPLSYVTALATTYGITLTVQGKGPSRRYVGKVG